VEEGKWEGGRKVRIRAYLVGAAAGAAIAIRVAITLFEVTAVIWCFHKYGFWKGPLVLVMLNFQMGLLVALVALAVAIVGGLFRFGVAAIRAWVR